MRRERIYTITEHDPGKTIIKMGLCPHCEQELPPIDLGPVLGYVQPCDVGKRVYLVDGIIQVESNEQRDRRLSNA